MTTLDEFLNFVLECSNEQINEQCKNDIFKIINCLTYIKNNIENIAQKVDAKNNIKSYLNKNDFENGVLRDDAYTSFHINNYKDGIRAKTELLRYIAYVEQCIDDMQQLNLLMEFARKFEFDASKGCLEARTSLALEFAGKQNSLSDTNNKKRNEAVDLEEKDEAFDLQEAFSQLFIQFTDDVDNNYQLVHAHFKPFLGKPIIYNNADTILTKEIINEYMEILGQTLEDVDSEMIATTIQETDTDPIEIIKKTFTETKPKINVGYHGMVQLRFDQEQDAKKALDSLKQSIPLAKLGVYNAKIKNEKNKFVFRLNEKQYNAIFGENAYGIITSPTKTSTTTITPKIKPIIQKSDLITALRTLSAEKYLKLFTEASPQDINRLTQRKDILSFALGNQSYLVVLALIEKSSKQAIDSQLTTPFINAIANHENAIIMFLALYSKANHQKLRSQIYTHILKKLGVKFIGKDLLLDELVQTKKIDELLTIIEENLKNACFVQLFMHEGLSIFGIDFRKLMLHKLIHDKNLDLLVFCYNQIVQNDTLLTTDNIAIINLLEEKLLYHFTPVQQKLLLALVPFLEKSLLEKANLNPHDKNLLLTPHDKYNNNPELANYYHI